MNKTFDFREALDCINNDIKVGLTLNGKTRYYYREDGKIVCKVNQTTYPVNTFYIDAVESNNWFIAEDEV